MADIDNQTFKEFLEELKKITGNREALRQKAKEVAAQEKNIDAIQQKIRELRKSTQGDKEATAAVNAFEQSMRGVVKEHKDFIETSKTLRGTFAGLGRAAFEGEGSISAFTDSFKGLGVIGDAFGLVGNRLDVNIETFRQLAQVGASFGQSIVELRTSAASAALPLDDFAKLVGENSQSLAALFGSTTQGARQIALLGEAVRRDGIERLAPLGFTVDEINETLLLNLDRQRRTNVFDRLSSQQRIQSAIQFAEELDRLARLTGAQRSELQSQIEAQQSNAKFQAFLQGATDQTRRRLEGFAASIGTIAPGLNEGFQDLIANAGVPVTESALALVQNIPEARNVVQDLINGTITSEQALSSLRDAAGRSVDRFRSATVTGQVEFLALQGDVINLARRINDVDSIFAEQGQTADRLTQGLTTFEDATKRIASQFQQIETGLLAGFGPALGGLSNLTQDFGKSIGSLVATVAKSPAASATALSALLAGKFLFSRADQILITAAGVKLGMTKVGFFKNLMNVGGRAGKFGLTRALPGVGAAVGIASSASMLLSDDEEQKRKGAFGLGGATLGAAIGTAILPGLGTLIGAGLGSIAGQFAGGAGRERREGMQFGGGIDAGKTYLVGETGPELITPGTKSTVSANQDLKATFDTEALENKMNDLVTQMSNANTTLTNMVNGVNTLVAIEGRSLKAVETTARKDRNQIGIV